MNERNSLIFTHDKYNIPTDISHPPPFRRVTKNHVSYEILIRIILSLLHGFLVSFLVGIYKLTYFVIFCIFGVFITVFT